MKKSSVIKWWWKECNNNYDYLLAELGSLDTPSGFPSVILFGTRSCPQGAGTIAPLFLMKKLKNKQDMGTDWKWSWYIFKGKSLIRSWNSRVSEYLHKTLEMNSFNKPIFPAFTNKSGTHISLDFSPPYIISKSPYGCLGCIHQWLSFSLLSFKWLKPCASLLPHSWSFLWEHIFLLRPSRSFNHRPLSLSSCTL